MRPVWLTLMAAAGRGRAAIVVATTALTSGLLLVAVSMARVRGPNVSGPDGRERLFAPLADEGTRPGVVLAVVLLTVPVLLLLDQAIRLGSTGQHRRYSALAVAGATRGDLRRWAAVEVGGPALLGAALGVPVWWLLRATLGTALSPQLGALVPSVGPGAWSLLVIAAVAAYGAGVGRRSGSRVTAVVERGGERPPPRPWPLLPLLAGVMVLRNAEDIDPLATYGAVVLVVGGAIGVAPWAAHRVSGLAGRRGGSAALLLASRRLQADPRPAGRAAAAVGAVAVTAGVLGAFVVDVLSSMDDYVGDYLVPAGLVGACAVLAVTVIAASLAVHAVETTLERRREMAALVATGIPTSTIGSAQVIEGLLTTLPLTVVGSVAGAVGYSALTGAALGSYVVGLAVMLLMVVVVTGMVWLANLLVRPWLMAAVEPAHLRTE